MGDKFQHYSYTNKSAHKDEVLKVIDSYAERRIDLNATIKKLDKAVAEYEHYKTQLGTAGTEELKNEYHSRMHFMDIMLKTHKL